MINVSQHLKTRRKKIDTSKVILLILLAYITLLTPFVLWIAIKGNTEPLTIMIEGTFALTSIAVGFYYWKAKAENLHKYKQNENITMGSD